VYVIEWDAYVAPLSEPARRALDPVLTNIVKRRGAAHRRLDRDLGSARYAKLVATWREWLDADEPDTADHGDRPLVDMATRRIERAHDRLVEQERGLTPSSDPEERHELRKDAKKLRYLIECFGSLYDKGARKDFVKDLKALQERLGQSQDADVHIAMLTSLAADVGGERAAETLLAMGQLTARLEQQRSAVRAEFAQGIGAYDTKATRQKFRTLIESSP